MNHSNGTAVSTAAAIRMITRLGAFIRSLAAHPGRPAAAFGGFAPPRFHMSYARLRRGRTA